MQHDFKGWEQWDVGTDCVSADVPFPGVRNSPTLQQQRIGCENERHRTTRCGTGARIQCCFVGIVASLVIIPSVVSARQLLTKIHTRLASGKPKTAVASARVPHDSCNEWVGAVSKIESEVPSSSSSTFQVADRNRRAFRVRRGTWNC